MAKTAVLKLKNRLKREMNIMETLSILKQIAISEFHFLEKVRRELSKYLVALESFFSFYGERGLEDSIFLKTPSRTRCVVALTSDEGFLGVLNNQIIDKTSEFFREHPDSQVVALGRRGARKLRDQGIAIREFPGVPFPLEYKAVLPLKAHLLDQYLRAEIGAVRIIYARCHSFTRQTVEFRDLLPFSRAELGPGQQADLSEEKGYIIVEPDAKTVVDYTIALWLGRTLYEIFWQSKLSELASRTIELTERHDNLSRSNAKTRIKYFRACHEVVDAGIREIFASLNFARNLKREEALVAEGDFDDR